MAIITVKNRAITLDAAEIPNLDASKITTGNFDASRIGSGTFADARIAASNVSQHATSFDDNKLVNDISTLGLRVHTQENLNASNTNSASFDVFQDSSGITNLTTAERNASEYVSAVTTVAADTTINLGNELSFDSAAGVGIVNGGHIDIVDNSWTSNSAWTSRVGDRVVGNTTGDVGEFGSYSSLVKNTTFSLGAMRIWGGHNNSNDPLGVKDVALYYSTDTTTGTDGNWTIITPLVYEVSTQSTDLRDRGNRNSGISSNHFIVSNFVNSNDQSNSYADVVAFPQITGVKSVRLDVRTGWNNGYYGSEKPHLTQCQFFDDGGVSNSSTTVSATGSFEGNAITASSTSSMGAVITYQDNAGTNTLNTDIILKLSADNGSNYSTATLTALPDFATGIKMAKVNDLSVTAGTQLKYKIEFANQASGSKEARIRGVSLQY